jgi:hypothetical protein
VESTSNLQRNHARPRGGLGGECGEGKGQEVEFLDPPIGMVFVSP